MDLYAQPDLDDGQVLPLHEAKKIFARMIAYPDYRVYVAEVDGKIVGTFALIIMDNLGHVGTPSGLIEDVAVSPSCQRQGIGKAMMQYAMERCRKAGCYKLTLSSHLKRTRAHEFYHSLGFTRHGYSFLIET